MIVLDDNRLEFSFPDVHPAARCSIEFQRTLHIPDDGHDHPLPPGLGSFPLRHLDDYAARLPDTWRERGGVMAPMHISMTCGRRQSATTVHNRKKAMTHRGASKPPRPILVPAGTM